MPLKNVNPNKPMPFSYYVLKSILPDYIEITKPLDKKEVERILGEIHQKDPDNFKNYITSLKILGDKIATYEGISLGIHEIKVDYSNRDKIVNTYKTKIDNAKTEQERLSYMMEAQKKLSEFDISHKDDDAKLMITSGAAGGKAGQLIKMRTTPFVVKDYKGNIINHVFKRSYSEGVDPVSYFYNAVETRKNAVEGKTSVTGPGEASKIFNNVMNSIICSMDDCGTSNGIELFTKDEDVLDRFLAKPAGGYLKNTLVTPDVQRVLLSKKIEKIIVRSPQTCEAPKNTVCKKCFGLKPDTGTLPEIGENLGLKSAQAMSEPITQLVISAKHSVTQAKVEENLEGFKGLKIITEMPENYPNRQIFCEHYGVVYRILPHSTGGKEIIIRQIGRKTPEKYIKFSQPVDGNGNINNATMFRYIISPQRKVLVKEKEEVYPGKPLTDGWTNVEDVARLRGIGPARSAMVENLQTLFKNTGQKIDRRHTELFAKGMFNTVTLDKSSKALGILKGEPVDYNTFVGKLNNIKSKYVPIDKAIGLTLAEPVLHYLAGTEVTPEVVQILKRNNIKQIKVTDEITVSPVVTSIAYAPLLRPDSWVSNLQHRYLKDTISTAAREAQSESVHGYNPIIAYAYGAELQDKDKEGKY